MNGASILLPACLAVARLLGDRRPEGKGPSASGTRELGWNEARGMIGMVGSMDDAAFRAGTRRRWRCRRQNRRCRVFHKDERGPTRPSAHGRLTIEHSSS